MSICDPAAIPRESDQSGDLPLVIQLVRYLIVGGAAFVVDLAALYVLTDWFGIHYLQSACLAFLAGLSANYVMSIGWVFRVRAVRSAKLEFLLFGLIGLVGLGLNELLMWSITQGLRSHYLNAKLASTVVVLAWNFSARKILLFSSSDVVSPQKAY